jgi:DNA topoisomerase IA
LDAFSHHGINMDILSTGSPARWTTGWLRHSPLLWRKVLAGYRPGVQSVALRLVVERGRRSMLYRRILDHRNRISA